MFQSYTLLLKVKSVFVYMWKFFLLFNLNVFHLIWRVGTLLLYKNLINVIYIEYIYWIFWVTYIYCQLSIFILPMKRFPSKARINFVHGWVNPLEWIRIKQVYLSKLTEWMIHWLSQDSYLFVIEWVSHSHVKLVCFRNESVFWTNWFNEWINDSLMKTVICHHLLVHLCNLSLKKIGSLSLHFFSCLFAWTQLIFFYLIF